MEGLHHREHIVEAYPLTIALIIYYLRFRCLKWPLTIATANINRGNPPIYDTKPDLTPACTH